VAEREHLLDVSVRRWSARRTSFLLLFFVGLLGVTSLAWGQFASKPGDVVGTVGDACISSANTYGWPDANGNILKCVSNVWTLVTQPGNGSGAAGTTGQVQFNNAGAFAADRKFFWDNTNKRLGIGSSSPAVSLDVAAGALNVVTGAYNSASYSRFGSLLAGSWTGIDQSYMFLQNANLSIANGNAALAQDSQGNTTVSAASGKTITIKQGVTATVTILSSGNVGIGTTAPSNKLEVAGNVLANGAGNTYSIVRAPAANEAGVIFRSGASDSWYMYRPASSNDLRVYDANGTPGDRVTFQSSTGNVGVGITNPGTKLDIASAVGTAITAVGNTDNARLEDTTSMAQGVGGALAFFGNYQGTSATIAGGIKALKTNSTSGDWGFDLAFATRLNGSSNVAEAMRITSTANVGIGTTGPGYPLDLQAAQGVLQVKSTTGTNSTYSRFSNTGGLGYVGVESSGGGNLFSGSSAYASVLGSVGGTALQFGTTDTIRATIDATGNVGIGTTNPVHTLDVIGPNTVPSLTSNDGSPFEIGNGSLALAMGVNGSGAEAWIQAKHRTADGNSYSLLLNPSGGNVGIGTTVPAYLLQVGSASASGIVLELQNSSGACTFQPSSSSLQTVCSSDRRLKDDIVDAVPALPQLADMRVRNYTIKASGERTIGVIAQEMIWKHADMVHMGAECMYGVEAPNIWLLVKAIQELKDTNDDLAARLSADDDALKAAIDNIAELRAALDAYRDAHP
jgi:endosialidase-like protein